MQLRAMSLQQGVGRIERVKFQIRDENRTLSITFLGKSLSHPRSLGRKITSRRSLGAANPLLKPSEMPETRVTRVARSASDCRSSRQEKAVIQTEGRSETDGRESGCQSLALQSLLLIPANGCKHGHKHPLLSHAGRLRTGCGETALCLSSHHKHAQIH